MTSSLKGKFLYKIDFFSQKVLTKTQILRPYQTSKLDAIVFVVVYGMHIVKV